MRSTKLIRFVGVASTIFLIHSGASAQIENPPSVKGRWGLSAGVTFDNYKFNPLSNAGMSPGVLPMLTYTYGKNQFEFGPQFQLLLRSRNQYLGINFQYKRYFNGFGNRFVPYFYSGIAFTTSKFEGLPMDDGTVYLTGNEYKQTGINLSVGYGLEWQLGRHFYLGSFVGLNPGIYSLTLDRIAGVPPISYTTKSTEFRFNFNVNAHIGFRFGK